VGSHTSFWVLHRHWFELKVVIVKILNVRYRPCTEGQVDTSVLVARVYCDARGLSLEPIQSALENTCPMLELRWLLEQSGLQTYESLLGFNTEHWTFDVLAREH
jgi:hypothetical protein